ncbi:hypothetical protein [Chryseobacterium sp. JM1]|uniref:hypothetical protein n=1 Tax=Chryseobacterium sp. JM1 TaxID=1233950 RepID=UPI0004E65EDA|nr:hypothetical protein [Chryseobacterium sp. JM1]KFF19583.1 hypothetical protein IW22_14775 [Chryseobacterium sp. JM1]
MKAWTLFSVILFPDIFRQRHTSTGHDNGNGFLQKKAKTIAADHYSYMPDLAKAVVPAFNIIKNHQKLIIITADKGAKTPAEQVRDYNSLSNNPKHKNSYLNRKSLRLYRVIHLVKKINAKINFRPHHSAETIVEITLIKANFL